MNVAPTGASSPSTTTAQRDASERIASSAIRASGAQGSSPPGDNGCSSTLSMPSQPTPVPNRMSCSPRMS